MKQEKNRQKLLAGLLPLLCIGLVACGLPQSGPEPSEGKKPAQSAPVARRPVLPTNPKASELTEPAKPKEENETDPFALGTTGLRYFPEDFHESGLIQSPLFEYLGDKESAINAVLLKPEYIHEESTGLRRDAIYDLYATLQEQESRAADGNSTPGVLYCEMYETDRTISTVHHFRDPRYEPAILGHFPDTFDKQSGKPQKLKDFFLTHKSFRPEALAAAWTEVQRARLAFDLAGHPPVKINGETLESTEIEEHLKEDGGWALEPEFVSFVPLKPDLLLVSVPSDYYDGYFSAMVYGAQLFRFHPNLLQTAVLNAPVGAGMLLIENPTREELEIARPRAEISTGTGEGATAFLATNLFPRATYQLVEWDNEKGFDAPPQDEEGRYTGELRRPVRKVLAEGKLGRGESLVVRSPLAPGGLARYGLRILYGDEVDGTRRGIEYDFEQRSNLHTRIEYRTETWYE